MGWATLWVGFSQSRLVTLIAVERRKTERNQGCQMVYFQTKNRNLGKLWRALQWKMLVSIFYGHLVYF
jgi:hypothetical protein